ncbi:MAG: glutathione S-transferase family protein [Alphaproteobacteria bacterium]|nr:glutathione S-transferase family protein [Alphaproteobacteria bacterium]
MTTVTIFGFPQSTYVRTVRMTCEEKGVPYVLEPVEWGAPSHRARHPFLRIPAFQHDGFTLYESLAIARYVDRAFAGPPLQPQEPKEAGRMDQWISAIGDYFYQTMIRELVFPRLVAPSRGQAPDEAVIAKAVPKAEGLLAATDATLAEDAYLAGPMVTLADLYLVPILFWLSKTPEGAPLLDAAPAVSRWYAAMEQRPSFAATLPPAP